MTHYRPPIEDILFAIKELAGLDSLASVTQFSDLSDELVMAILTEAGKFMAGELAPLNRIGDEIGARLEGGRVVMPAGFREAYQKLIEDGWVSLPFPPEEGGQGLPAALFFTVAEMMQSANLAFSMCPLLAPAAVSLLRRYASDALKAEYLPRLVSGEWTATMALTEAQAGSDLSVVRTKATPQGNHYLIRGQKQFISFGDHDMVDNVVHLVLAQITESAPTGSAGLSLFLVPKKIPDASGLANEVNAIEVVSLEHKMGLRASPTCSLSFGGNDGSDSKGAVGYIVGNPGQGLPIMFTMMNHARLQVGSQAAAMTERAYQHALAYAKERIQGRERGTGKPIPIIEHPDVRRMLLTMKAGVEAIRAIVYSTGVCLDLSECAESHDDREKNRRRVEWMTPIVKGWSTEIAQEFIQMAVQIHGGMGYVEETGVSQYMRDARVMTIYEGTSGIQAMDLVQRKLLKDKGAMFREWINELRGSLAADDSREEREADIFDVLTTIRQAVKESVDRLEFSSDWIIANSKDNPALPGSIGFDYMMQAGMVAGGFQMFRSAKIASEKILPNGSDDRFYREKLNTARFYSQHILPRAEYHGKVVLCET